MNSTTPKRHAETLRNRNIPFQLKKQNTCQNGIDNLDQNVNTCMSSHTHTRSVACTTLLARLNSF